MGDIDNEYIGAEIQKIIAPPTQDKKERGQYNWKFPFFKKELLLIQYSNQYFDSFEIWNF